MERVGDTLLRMRLREFQRRFPPEAPEDPTPTCPVCKDYGFVRHDVPLDHPDFGRAFPCTCRQADVRDRLRRRSNLGPLSNRTFDSFSTEGRGPLSELARHRLREALEVCRSYAEAPLDWLVLSGPSGCGKTHLAAAIANRQIEKGTEAFFAVVPDLLDHLRATYGPNSDVTYDELFDSVRNAPLLVLDDLGTQSGSPWAQEKLFQLLNHRFNAELPTVITTNHRLSELDERLRARLEDTRVARVVRVQEWESPIAEALLDNWPPGLRAQRFETFRTDDLPNRGPRDRASLTRAFNCAATFATEPSGWLVLVGDVGRGKTHLAAAIKNHRDEHGEPTLFMTVPDLLDYLRATYAPSSDITYDRGFDAVRNAPVLILDDYGAHSSTPWAEEKLFQLLNFRFNAQLPTVITTNLPFDQPDTLAPELQQELRILSRLVDRGLSQIVRIDAPPFNRTLPTLRSRRESERDRRSSRGAPPSSP
jgi:DNA replication protein DnaC